MANDLQVPVLADGLFTGKPLDHIRAASVEFAAAGLTTHSLRSFDGATAAQRLDSALQQLTNAGAESRLVITEDILLDETLILDLKAVSIDFAGHKVISRVKNGPALLVGNSTGRVTPMNQRVITGLHLVGPGSTSAGSVGIRFMTDDPTGTNNSRGAAFYNLIIEEFETGLSFGKNAYLLKFINGHIFKCNTCVRVEDLHHDPALENTNYGENIGFYHFGFGNSKLGFYLGDNALTDVNCTSCSFDFLQGGGQRMAVVKSGQLNCSDAHIEFNGALTAGPAISVGPNSAAEVRINGGRIQHNNVPPAGVDYWFESLNPHRSGGITLANVTMHFIEASSGVLCSGPGPFKTHNLSYPSGVDGSGFAAMTVLTSRANNLLADPTFSRAQNIDVQVLDADATSLTESSSHSIKNVNGKMVLTKKTTGPGSFMISVPAVPGKFYAAGFKLSSVTPSEGAAPGRFRLQERFAAVAPGADALGREKVTRTESRPEASWDAASLPGVWKAFGPIYAGGKQVLSRSAPYWATRYQVVIPVSNLAPGVYEFEEILMTGA